ncbi:hypothetical protein NRB20_26230 [Nocardia sp. RB20]|uniref:Uncharacterized protein n=2 Tax=Nocardia macrotermitis TaxID=2585198 RepID=A0A7K0D1D6_9NOCA|nr:hypothetical protein [Nocardia macrotermitis]
MPGGKGAPGVGDRPEYPSLPGTGSFGPPDMSLPDRSGIHNGANGLDGPNSPSQQGDSNGAQYPGPPGLPGLPGAAPRGSDSSRKRKNYIPRVGSGIGPGNGHGNGTEIYVRSHTGWGESAAFDPATGVLRPVELALGGLAGVYGDLGGTPIVFYRNGNGLALHVNTRGIDLDSPDVATHWQRIDSLRTRFAVAVGGVVVCDLYYPSAPDETDLGLLIRDVLADPDRRGQIFAR